MCFALLCTRFAHKHCQHHDKGMLDSALSTVEQLSAQVVAYEGETLQLKCKLLKKADRRSEAESMAFTEGALWVSNVGLKALDRFNDRVWDLTHQLFDHVPTLLAGVVSPQSQADGTTSLSLNQGREAAAAVNARLIEYMDCVAGAQKALRTRYEK